MDGYGNAPANDQIEITVFGPGCGEAIAVHLGDQHWVLVDSCLHPENKEPATLHYLRSIGVDPQAVRVILASHWHDDHIQGLAALSDACPTAELYISDVFTDQEALSYLAAYGGPAANSQTRGTKELFKTISSREATPVNQCTLLHEATVAGHKVRLVTLSPTHQAHSSWIKRMVSYLPRNGDDPINHSPELSPNEAAVALHIDFGDDAIILGSDVINHPKYGWPAILEDPRCKNFQKASVYKIAHHGSSKSDVPALWTTLIAEKPIAAVTPFTRSRLPRPEDITRIQGLASAAFISTAGSKRPKIDRSQVKRMEAICTNLVSEDSGFGAVRLRRRYGEMEWNPELFGLARKL